MAVDDKSTYYDRGGIETIAIIRAKLTQDQYVGFLLGCILKYSTRMNFKDCFDRDLEKIGVYQKLLSEVKREADLEELINGSCFTIDKQDNQDGFLKTDLIDAFSWVKWLYIDQFGHITLCEIRPLFYKDSSKKELVNLQGRVSKIETPRLKSDEVSMERTLVSNPADALLLYSWNDFVQYLPWK